jgi:hypothetical protein
MVGQDPTIRLLEFRGDGSDDLENIFFICEKIWAKKQITYEYTKVAQLEITFRDHTLDWYMGLTTNNPKGEPTTVV